MGAQVGRAGPPSGWLPSSGSRGGCQPTGGQDRIPVVAGCGAQKGDPGTDVGPLYLSFCLKLFT